MPTGELAGGRGQACAVSLRQGVYWIGRAGSPTGTAKRQLDDGSLITAIATGSVRSMEKTANQRFLVLAADSVKTVHMQGDAILDSTYLATLVSVCDDITIVSAFEDPVIGGLTRHNVDGTGTVVTSAQLDIAPTAIACSPGGTFVVAFYDTLISSFVVSSLTIVDTLALPHNTFSIVFNPALSDVYFLQFNGKLSVYAFNSDGTFGVLKASTDIGFVYTSAAGTSVLEFAYGNLFVHAADQLFTYDAALNLKSSQTIVTGQKSAICVSEGTNGFVCWALLSS
jgi:hypothetical protein